MGGGVEVFSFHLLRQWREYLILRSERKKELFHSLQSATNSDNVTLYACFNADFSSSSFSFCSQARNITERKTFRTKHELVLYKIRIH